MSEEIIAIQVKNNTGAVVPVSLFGNDGDLSDNSNFTTEYQWDITALVFTNQNTVSVQYKRNGATSYQTFTAPMTAANLDALLNALNTLGIGSFFSYTSGPNTYIANYDDDYQFGLLTVFNPTASPIFIDVITTNAGGDSNVDVNGVNVFNEVNPFGPDPTFIDAIGGDVVTVYGTAPSLGLTVFSVYDMTAGVYLINTFVAKNAPFTFSFTTFSGHTYQIKIYS